MREHKLVYGLVLFISAVAVVCLALMLWLVFAAPRASRVQSRPATSATTATSLRKSSISGEAIDVVRVNGWITENGAYDGGEKVARVVTPAPKDTVATVAAPDPQPAPIPEPKPEPAPEPEPAVEPAWIDEDVAKAEMRAEGYTVHSVYLFDAGALKGGTKPPAGATLDRQTFTGRTKGEKLAFLNIATVLPYKDARKVPDLKGKAWRSARSQLSSLGLGIKYEYEHESLDTYGTVVFQAPAPGAPMPKGCSVFVVLAD